MNDQLDQETLESLYEDLKVFEGIIHQLKTQIIEQGVSNYPIFIAHQADIELGKEIMNKVDLAITWSLSVSHLEEFVKKEIISANKAPNFIDVYKASINSYCLFVFADDSSSFVFIPFKS